MTEEVYRVIGTQRGERKVWRYRSRPDAVWRANYLGSDLLEFSVGKVSWSPAPSAWLEE